jgi:ABC-2 type transport system ATP-binding protein
VIFSSHILQEVQAVCDRVIVINNGVLIANDTLENLSRMGDDRLFLCVEGSGEELLGDIRALPGLRSARLLSGIEWADHGEGEGTAAFELESEAGKDPRRDLFRLLAAKDRPILSLRRSGISLEDAFIRLTAGDQDALRAIAGIAAGVGAAEASAGDAAAGSAEAGEGAESAGAVDVEADAGSEGTGSAEAGKGAGGEDAAGPDTNEGAEG